MSKLTQLQAINVWNESSLIRRTNLALEIFGFATICRNRVDDYEMDLPAVAKKNGWFVRPGMMQYGIFTSEPTNLIPDKRETAGKKRSAD
jgi:hypothetical protein